MTYMDAQEDTRGRADALTEWAAGTTRPIAEVCFWNHSSYGLAYRDQIEELKRQHSSRPDDPPVLLGVA